MKFKIKNIFMKYYHCLLISRSLSVFQKYICLIFYWLDEVGSEEEGASQ